MRSPASPRTPAITLNSVGLIENGLEHNPEKKRKAHCVNIEYTRFDRIVAC